MSRSCGELISRKDFDRREVDGAFTFGTSLFLNLPS